MATDLDLAVGDCVRFTEHLRLAGVTAPRTDGFLTALDVVDPLKRSDVYWAGRATLCSSPDDLAIYDLAFAEWFGGTADLDDGQLPETAATPISTLPMRDDDQANGADEDERIHAASREELLRRRDVATLDEEERRRLADLFGSLAVVLPERRRRRRLRRHRGELDLRATTREQLRSGGEVGRLVRRRPARTPRRVVFLVDVSRSMSSYADHLLRLAHRVRQVEPRSVEIFTVATRVTRVTAAADVPDQELALVRVGDLTPDWSGGTRLADGLRTFIDAWGRRGMARRAVVVIASDGWERGDSGPLAEQVERLGRIAHRVIWVNPHSGKDGYEPVQSGIAAILPHVDDMVAGHTFESFERLLAVIADVRHAR